MLLPGQITQEEAAALDGPPSLLSRLGQGAANAPMESYNMGARLLFNLGLTGENDQQEADQIPNLYDLPPARNFAEKAVDFTTGILPQIPYFLAGEGVAGEAINLLGGAGKAVTGAAKGAAGFGLIGETDKEPTPLSSAAIGAVMGAAPELISPLFKKKKILRPEEQPPSLVPPKQVDTLAPSKGEPPPVPAKSAAESAQAMTEAENANEAKSLTAGRLLRERLAFEESQNAATQAPDIFAAPKSAQESANVIAHNFQEVDNLHAEAQGDSAGSMLRQHLKNQEYTSRGLPPPGSLVENPALTEGEALRFSREKRGVTAPEGSLVREPTYTENEARLYAEGKNPKVATLQQPIKFEQPKPTKQAKVVGPVLTDADGKVLSEAKLGANHSDITQPAIKNLLESNPNSDLTLHHQFRTADGKVLDREAAWKAAKANGQIKDAIVNPTETIAKANGKKPQLHSQMLKSEFEPPTPKLEEETVRSRAVQYRGKIFEANTHQDAAAKMRKSYPEAKTVKGLAEIRSGYVTSRGRFIGQKEADLMKLGPKQEADIAFEKAAKAKKSEPKITFELQEDIFKNIKEYAPAVKSMAGKVFKAETHEDAMIAMQQSSNFVDESTSAKNGRGYVNRKTGEFQTLMDIARERMSPKKKVATLQPKAAVIPPSLLEKGSKVATTDVEGKPAIGTVVSHDAKTGLTKVDVEGEVLDKYTKDLEASEQGTAAGDLTQIGGMEAFEDLEKKTIARKSGLKLKQKLPEVGAAPAEVVSKIARYVALPAVAGAVGYAIAEPDNRTASAAAFAFGALGLGLATPKLLRRLAEANPDVMNAGSVANTIAKVASTAKEVVTASEKVANKVARDQPSASGADLFTLWMSRHFTTDPAMIRIKDKAYGIVDGFQKIIQTGQASLAQMAMSPADRALLLEYWNGTVSPNHFQQNVSSDSLKTIAMGMRESATALSEIIYESLPEGELKNVFAGRADSYLTDTYRMFHDSKHMPSEAIIDAAAQDLSSELNGSLENRKAILRQYQHEVQVNRASYGFNKQGNTLGATFGDAISRKDGEMKQSFKDFLGVYNDPIEKMAATADKLTRGARTAGFFNEIVALEKPNGLKATYTKPAMDLARESLEHDIAKAKGQGLQGEVATLQQKLDDLNSYQYNPTNVQHGKLSDTFVDRRTHDALKTYDSMITNSTSGVIRAMTDTTNAIKYGKIILSPLQFARQIITMPIIGAMSKTHPGDWARAAYSLLKDPVERARLVRTGVLQGDQITGMFKQDFSAIMTGKMTDMFAQSKIAKGLRTWEEAFRTPDLIIRVAAFQKEEARLLRAGKTALQAEQGAIDFANRYTMNYGAVPPGIKVVRKVPFVNQYLTFAYEISRITKNLMEDAFHDTGVGRVHALSTLTTLATVPFIIQKLTESQLSPKDLEAWNKVKNLSPDYNRSDFKFVTGRDKNGNFHYVNFTPLLVHDRWQKMTVDAFKGDFKAFMADNPIFGWENTPLLNVASNQMTGKDIHTGKELDTWGARIASLRRDTMPPLLGTDLDKFVDAMTPNAEGSRGLTNLRTGQSSTIGQMLASYITSIRGYTVNPDVLTRRAMTEAQQASANARSYYYRVASSNATLQQKSQALAQFQTTQKQIMMALRDKLRLNPALQSNVQ